MKDSSECWIEIKRAWEGRGYVSKASELMASWKADVSKLRRAKPADHRAFVLFTFSDADPCSEKTALCRAVQGFRSHDRIQGEKNSLSFQWRSKFNYMSVFIWLLPESA